MWKLTPLFGSILFMFSYLIAAWCYPGFSWTKNYWCNLLNETTINGLPNPGRPIAMTGMIIISITMITFWYIFPLLTGFKKQARLIIQVSGFIAMTTGLFIFTSLHDTIVNIASIFGLIAIAGTIVGLKKLKWTRLFWMGMFIAVLVILNNLLYHTDGWMIYLPLVQAFTFIYFLLWICFVDVALYKL